MSVMVPCRYLHGKVLYFFPLLVGMSLEKVEGEGEGGVCPSVKFNQFYNIYESQRPLFSKKECSMLVMIPCSKMSPPKSCVLLEPISEISHQGNYRFRKATPFPVGINCSRSQLSESSGSDTSEGLAFKYPELLGIQGAYKPGIGKKKVEASPGWFGSPPKTCILHQPPDEKSLSDAADGCQMPLSHVFNQQKNLLFAKQDNVQCGVQQTSKSCNHEPLGGNLASIDSTPMWKEPESTIH